jgi:predicted O-linked N-acetylglucosamine transferase (SPINDLY family)
MRRKPRAAVTACEQLLRLGTADAETLHLCALAYNEAGSTPKACELLDRAVALDPQKALYRSNLSHLLLGMGDIKGAEQQARKAIALDPELADAQNHLGNALKSMGDLAEAVGHYRRAVELDPQRALFRFNLGAALQQQGSLSEAETCYRQVLAVVPEWAPALTNMGGLYLQTGCWAEACETLTRAATADPANATTANNLGLALLRTGKAQSAVEWFEKAIALDPSFAGAYCNLGTAREVLAEPDRAILAYEQALVIDPRLAMARANLLRLLAVQGEFERASPHLTEAIREPTAYEEALPAVMNLLQSSCDFRGRRQVLDLLSHSVLAKKFDVKTADGALLSLNYEDVPEATLFDCHRSWAELVESAIDGRMYLTSPAVIARRREKIRVGYMSPDFRGHAMAYFMEPIIEHHDRNQFEVYCYHTIARTDDVTRSIAAKADRFVPAFDLDASALAQRIHSDDIDILVDMAGHTRGNRLAVLAYRPSPVQITYLGYPNTTGLTAVDYMLIDRFIALGAEVCSSEEPLELPGPLLTYPESGAFVRAELPPCRRDRRLTFGSLNNLTKISASAIRAWVKILLKVPESRLLIAYVGADSRIVQENISREFAVHGVSRDRLAFAGKRPRFDFVQLYNEVDVLLDTFPYTGTTTTCEALWMGVPVVTLAGNTQRSRVSGSILSAIGAEDLIATSAERYIELAVALSSDTDKLAQLRLELPERMRRSTVGRPDLFTRQLEATYVTAVEQKLAAASPAPP